MTEKESLFTKAIVFAAEKHCGQIRKGTDIGDSSGVPYIVHPMEAAAIVSTMTDDREILAAAILHDVIEDAGVAKEELVKEFGERVAELVCAESEDKRAGKPAADTWALRKGETLIRLEKTGVDAKMICLGDKLSNLRAMKRDIQDLGKSFWGRFNQSDPAAHGWYYAGVAERLTELAEYPVYKEYVELVDDVFGACRYVDYWKKELPEFPKTDC